MSAVFTFSRLTVTIVSVVYPEEISRVLDRLSHRGPGSGEFIGVDGNFSCGSYIRFKLEVDRSRDSIKRASYASNGCGYMIAAAEMFAEELEGRVFASLRGLDGAILDAILLERIGSIPEERRECSNTVITAIRNAFAELRLRRIEEFRGERALICTCFGVTEDRIAAVIEAGADRIEEVTRLCNAGGGCGSCHMMIRELIDAHSGIES